MSQVLEAEIQAFEQRLADLLRDHAGQAVLIHGREVVGFFPTMDAALAEGYRRFGGTPFLAKVIEVEVAAVFASNLIRPPSAR